MEIMTEPRSGSRQSLSSSHKGSSTFKQARHILSKPSLRFKLSSPSISVSSFVEHPSLALPVDIADSTWLEGLENSGFLRPGSLASSTVAPRSRPRCESAPQEPVASVTRQYSNDSERCPSNDSASSLASPASSATTEPTITRSDQSSIFRVGHIVHQPSRSLAPSNRQVADAAGKTRSIDLIAESYNAILESRDALEYEALFGDMPPQPETPSEQRPETVVLANDVQPEKYPYQNTEQRGLQRPPGPHRLPTNDNGAIIGFEEDAIYFKPVSLLSSKPATSSQEPQPEQKSQSSPLSDTSQTASNKSSREKCEDLLKAEIGSAVAKTSSAEEAALQVGMMIKTYEKLRDQVMTEEALKDEADGVKSAFDSWLVALTSVHDKLVNDATGETAVEEEPEKIEFLPQTTYH